MLNVPANSVVGAVVETVFVPDGTALSCTIHTYGDASDVWKTIDGEVSGCSWKEEVDLSDLDKEFEADQTPLVVHVDIADYGISACSLVMVVLKEGFVFAT